MESGCLGERLGRRWEAKWPLAATILAPWGRCGGSWAVFGVPLGCSRGDSGCQEDDQGGPKAGHRGIWGSKEPLEGSWARFAGGFEAEKNNFEGLKPLNSIGRANEMSIFRVLDTRHETGPWI